MLNNIRAFFNKCYVVVWCSLDMSKGNSLLSLRLIGSALFGFQPGYTCRSTVSFGTLKDCILQINSLAFNNCFSYRKVFRNGVNALSKMINHVFCLFVCFLFCLFCSCFCFCFLFVCLVFVVVLFCFVLFFQKAQNFV